MNELKAKRRKMFEFQPIYSMWLRGILRFYGSKPRVAATFIQPFIFLAFMVFPMGMMFKRVGSLPGGEQLMQGINHVFAGLPVVSFLVPGIIGLGLLFGGIMSGITVLWDKDYGFLKEVMVAPVSRISLMVGRSLGSMTTSLIQALMTLAVGLLIGYKLGFHIVSFLGFLLAIVFMILTFSIFVGFGLWLGGLFEETEGFMALVQLIQMPIMFLSGLFMPITQLKNIPGMYQIQFLNPLTYGIDGIRGALSGTYFISWWVDLVVTVGCALFFLILGAYSFSKMEVS